MTEYGVTLATHSQVDALEPPAYIVQLLRNNYERSAREVAELPGWDDKFIMRGPAGVDDDGVPFRRWAWYVKVDD